MLLSACCSLGFYVSWLPISGWRQIETLPYRQVSKPAEQRLKRKLNLTVHSDVKRKARRLARQRYRSVSSLFEVLIDKEHARVFPRKAYRLLRRWV